MGDGRAVTNEEPKLTKNERLVCCIGDLHGYFSKLQNLWSNLETLIDPSSFQSALIIFLGDYCDRGPDTQKVIDFLISLPSKYPNQTHIFLCGNHDLAFAAFVGVLPKPPDGSDFAETWKEYEHNEEREGWFKGIGYESMHLQGRRWAGSIKDRFNFAKGMEYKGSIYDAGPTFESYGVEHGSADLIRAVPDEHKKFLADLVWVHEEDDVCVETPEGRKHCKLIAVHAGLEKAKGVEEQLKLLEARDTRVPKVEALSGRKNVREIPKELCEKPTLMVSGHHGELHIDGLRLIIDEGGGYENKPVAAIILPSMRIIRDTDVIVDLIRTAPDEHKKFLADLDLVHEEELCEKSTLMVRGHHGELHIDGLRLIIDEGGGYENKPVAAIILPSISIIHDTNVIRE